MQWPTVIVEAGAVRQHGVGGDAATGLRLDAWAGGEDEGVWLRRRSA